MGKRIVLRVDKELYAILDKIRTELSKKGVNISYAEASKILVKWLKKKDDDFEEILRNLKLF